VFRCAGYNQEKWDIDTDGGDSADESSADIPEACDENVLSRDLTDHPEPSRDEEQSQDSKGIPFPFVQSLLSLRLGFGLSRPIDSQSNSNIETESVPVEPIVYDEDAWWRNLPDQVRVAAGVLGYTEELWDKDKEPPSCNKSWANLSPEEQRAATILGYNKYKWDDDEDDGSYSS
jgi:hypothetical protein